MSATPFDPLASPSPDGRPGRADPPPEAEDPAAGDPAAGGLGADIPPEPVGPDYVPDQVLPDLTPPYPAREITVPVPDTKD